MLNTVPFVSKLPHLPPPSPAHLRTWVKRAYLQAIIIGRSWAKYRDLLVASRSIQMRQITDLQDTDESQYFAITEFKLFYHSITEFVLNYLQSNLLVSYKSDRKKEKSVVSFTHEHTITCSQTELADIAHEQTIICRQLFTGHLVDSRPMKRKKNLY